MIPKKIHYCWFGKGNLPESAKKYIESWKKYCPDYEIIEWNEENFDINSNEYVRQAYEMKKYAFVTDYVRLYALYNIGGIYMDTDVEVLKSLDSFLENKAFSGFEDSNLVPTGIMGAEKNNKWIKDLLDEYKDIKFIDKDGNMDLTTNVTRITNLTVKKYGLITKSSYQKLNNGEVVFYPFDYFCPKSWKTGKITLTNNSYTIHHFSGSWLSTEEQLKNSIYKKCICLFGEFLGKIIARVIYYFMHPKKIILKLKKEKNNEKD